MTTKKTLLLLIMGGSIVSFPGATLAAEVGFGYARDIRNSLDLEQYEVFDRLALPYTADWGNLGTLSTAVEFGAALIRYYGDDDAVTGRFSAMPMAVLSPHENINILAGFGAGFMVGQTQFGEHYLDGPILFNAKVGVQLLLSESWGIEYTFYHQSNFSIYEHNNSLNMNQLSVTFRF